MARQVIRSSESLRDIVELTDYIALSSLDAAFRFLEAVESTFNFLATNHEVGQLCQFDNPETEGLRCWRVDRFPNHLIFYRATEDSVIVERIFHGARDVAKLFGDRNS